MIIYKVEWFIPKFNTDGTFYKHETYKFFSKKEDAQQFQKELLSFAKKLNWKWFTSYIVEEEVE